MDISALEAAGSIEKVAMGRQRAEEALKLTLRDLNTAEQILSEDPDWSLIISYNAMLQSAKAAMFASGYRPKGSNQHYTVLEFARSVFGGVYTDRLISAFDRARRTRHRAVYDSAGMVSESAARDILGMAQEFMEKSRTIVEKAPKTVP